MFCLSPLLETRIHANRMFTALAWHAYVPTNFGISKLNVSVKLLNAALMNKSCSEPHMTSTTIFYFILFWKSTNSHAAAQKTAAYINDNVLNVLLHTSVR